MTTTVLALFTEPKEAEQAVRALRSAHFDSVRVGIVRPGEARPPRFGRSAMVGIVIGTIGCGVLGGILGLFAAGMVPGIGAWLPGGWFAVMMLGLAAASTGAVAGLLMSQSAASQDALYYEDEVAAGRTLVSVSSDPELADVARRILLDEGAFEAAPIDKPIAKAS